MKLKVESARKYTLGCLIQGGGGVVIIRTSRITFNHK